MHKTEESTRIGALARGIRLVAIASSGAYIVFTAYGISGVSGPTWLAVTSELPGLWGAAEAVAVALFVLLGLRELMRMMRRVEAGALFSAVTIAHFRRFASFALLSVLADLILPVAHQTWGAIRGETGVLALSLDNSSFLLLLVCLVTFLVSRMLEIGAAYAEDSRSIV